MRSVVQAVAGETKQDPVEALCISSHGETFVPVDDHLQPLGPAILNIDNRAVEQTNWLTTRLGLETIFEITGLTQLLDNYKAASVLKVRAKRPDGGTVEIKTTLRIDTPQEVLYYKHGGILQFVLRQLLAAKKPAVVR